MARARKGLTVSVELEALDDERFAVLADVMGVEIDLVFGKMLRLWAWILKSQIYVVHDAVIRRFLGPHGVEAILANGVDQLALGRRESANGVDGIYVKGTRDRFGWLADRRAAASSGGEERAGAADRNQSGEFVPTQPDSVAQPTTEDRLAGGPGTDHPASSSSSSSQITTHARARREGVPELARKFLNAAVAAFVDLKATPKMSVPPMVRWALMPSAADPGWEALLNLCERLLAIMPFDEAEKLGMHRIAVAKASAIASNDACWFTPMRMWDVENFMKGTELTVEQAARGQRENRPVKQDAQPVRRNKGWLNTPPKVAS